MKSCLAFIISCTLIGTPFLSYAITNADTVRQQIQDIATQIQALDKEIAQYQDQIATTSEQSASLSSLIKELTLTRSKLLKEKEQNQKKISATVAVIGTLDTNIASDSKTIEKSKSAVRKMLGAIYEEDQVPLVARILAGSTIHEMSREYNNAVTMNTVFRDKATQLTNQVRALDVTRTQKQQEKQNLTTLQKSLALKQQAIEATKKEKDTLLSATKNKESNYKKMLAESQKKRDTFEKDLETYESQLKFILDPKLLPTEGTGVLSWPLDKVYITQLFGKTVSSKRLYVSGSHSGVDFRASVGTEVKSMGTGTVEGFGDTDTYCKGASFGKWVFIKYDNGLSSTFGHLSVINATTGQKVKAGDIVGLSGNTGHSTGPHLHVTVYASEGASVKTVPSLSCSGKTFIMPIAPTKAYLDPMLYLPSISTKSIKDYRVKD